MTSKFGVNDCYVCSNAYNTIASHIHRVSDRKGDITLTYQEKTEQAISGENGLYLCMDCDKHFEKGAFSINSS